MQNVFKPPGSVSISSDEVYWPASTRNKLSQALTFYTALKQDQGLGCHYLVISEEYSASHQD